MKQQQLSLSILIITLVCAPFLLWGQTDGPTIVAVGEAEVELVKIQFAPPVFKGSLSGDERKLGEGLVELLANDFSFYKHKFSVTKPSGELAGEFPSAPPYDTLIRRGISNWSRVMVTSAGGGAIRYRVELFSVEKQVPLFTQSGILRSKGWRTEGHQLSDSLYQTLTGKSSIFTSSIFFVSDYGSSRKNFFKELYQMDFDGQNIKRLTNHRGTVISPAVSPDGKKVLYSLIKSKKQAMRGAKKFRRNINLYMLDLASGVRKLISSRPGLNSGAIFSADGKSIYLTMSFVGNAEIYRLRLADRKLFRITRNYAHDVDPSTSRVGDERLTFLSNRPGKAMIYILNPKGTEREVTRISYVGDFNATPRFSPDGRDIAFSSWVDGRFDIYRINHQGGELSRLTKNFGSNEDPSYSPDGEFITFSSQRVLSSDRATHNLYIMDRNGEILGAVTRKIGNCITPRWSN